MARLCRKCHDLHHFGNDFDLDAVLLLKALYDPEWYDEAALAELFCRKECP